MSESPASDSRRLRMARSGLPATTHLQSSRSFADLPGRFGLRRDGFGYATFMVATYLQTTPDERWTWEGGEIACDGCGHRLAARAARIVSYGPVRPDGTADDRPRVFHRLSCAARYLDARTIDLGLRDL